MADAPVEVAVEPLHRGHPEDEPPTRAEPIPHVAQRGGVILDVLQDVDHHHGVEGTLVDGAVEVGVDDLHHGIGVEALAQQSRTPL